MRLAVLKSAPGDLLHGDRHGVHTIPLEIAHDIPKVAAGLLAEERSLIELCRAPDFSLEKLAARLRKTNPGLSPPLKRDDIVDK